MSMSEKTTVGHYGYNDVGGYQPPKGRATPSSHAPTGEFALAMPSGEFLGMACRCGGAIDAATGRCSNAAPPTPSVPLPVLQALVSKWQQVAKKSLPADYKLCLENRAEELEAVIRAHQPKAGT